MATEIGSIKTLIGTAIATSLDGTPRNLQVGDKVFASDIITTGAAGAIEIEFLDGSLMDLGRSSQAILDAEVFDPQQATQIADTEDSDVDALQQALLDGTDPTQAGEATAAGADSQQSGDEGASSVTIDYLAPEAPVTSGFETTPPSIAFLSGIEDDGVSVLQVEPPVPPVVNDLPEVSTTQVEDVAYEFTITNHDEISFAYYHSSYGYYIKDANGEPESGVIVWDDVHDTDTVPVTVTGYTPDQIGFFIIANGDARNTSLIDGAEVTFSQDGNHNWVATLLDGTSLVGVGANVIFNDPSLNSDGKNHVQDNGTVGNQNWEDMPIVSGDGDYNDVNINVTWTKVTTEGTALGDFSYGNDGAGSINFTLEDVSVTGGGLFSNGNEVTFTAKDTNSDGINDQLVGATSSGDVVLTIDGVLDSDNYDVTLFADNPIDQGSSTDLAINAKVQVTDADGDTAVASLHFDLNVSDFIPPVIPD